MGRAVLAGVLLFGGCDRLFGLREVPDAFTVDSPESADAHMPIVIPGCWDAFYQDDEDGDFVVDGCDTCPFDVDPAQLDSDGDTIGDACDPNPAEAIERRAFFDPMVNLSELSWKESGTTTLTSWRTADTIPGFGIKQTNRGNNGQELDSTLRIRDRVFDQPSVQLQLLSMTGDTDYEDLSTAGVYIMLEPDLEVAPNGFACAIDAANTEQTANPHAFARVRQGRTIADSRLPVPTSRVQIRATTQRPGMTPAQSVVPSCDVHWQMVGGVPMSVSPEVGIGIVPTRAQVGLWTSNASATFVGILVYERKP